MIEPQHPTRRSLFFRLWWRSISVKRPQAALTVLSLLVGAAVVSMLLNLYGGVRRKMLQEFRAYGPNVVLAPAPGPSPEGSPGSALMDQEVMQPVRQFALQRKGVWAVPVLYGVVHLKRIPPDPRLPEFENVVAVGTDFEALRRMNPGWRETKTTGFSSALSPATCAVGLQLSSRLHSGLGDAVSLEPLASNPEESANRGVTCKLASILTTGSSEDDQVFLPLEELQRVMGVTKLSLVQLRLSGGTGDIESSIRELSKALPGVDVRPIHQIVYAEGRVLGVIRWFLVSVTALILVVIAICLAATMTAIVLERRKDIGMMKALGASDLQVMRLFLAEGAALGIVGGCAGFFAGCLWAYGLAHHLFGVTLNVIWWTWPLVCGFAVLLALGAAALPVRIVRTIQPAAVLKGE